MKMFEVSYNLNEDQQKLLSKPHHVLFGTIRVIDGRYHVNRNNPHTKVYFTMADAVRSFELEECLQEGLIESYTIKEIDA